MRTTRISKCNSPIPEMIVWLVSSSLRTRKVGSSSDKRLIILRQTRHGLARFDIGSRRGRHIARGREVIAHGIEKRLNPFIFIGGPTKYGAKLARDGGFSDGGHNLLFGDFFSFQKFFH